MVLLPLELLNYTRYNCVRAFQLSNSNVAEFVIPLLRVAAPWHLLSLFKGSSTTVWSKIIIYNRRSNRYDLEENRRTAKRHGMLNAIRV